MSVMSGMDLDYVEGKGRDSFPSGCPICNALVFRYVPKTESVREEEWQFNCGFWISRNPSESPEKFDCKRHCFDVHEAVVDALEELVEDQLT